MWSACKSCCSLMIPVQFETHKQRKSSPLVTINMYNDDTNDDEVSAESKQLLPSGKNYTSPLGEYESQLLSEDIDAASLKMVCLERIKVIEEDLRDPDLTTTERIINQMNIKSLKTVVENARLNEKINLGSLQCSQYTDAVILQKQVACNFAGQREYSDVLRPVIFSQPINETSVKYEENNISSNFTPIDSPHKNNIKECAQAV